MRAYLLSLLIIIAALTCACVPIQSEATSSEVVTFYVGPEKVECVGVAPQTCLMVKTEPDGEYTYFYGNIEGFEYE